MKFNLNLPLSIFLKPKIVRCFPYHLQLEPTNSCNLRCKMCIRNEGNFKNVSLGYNDFVKIYDSINPAKITFAGAGEPTLNKDLPAMIDYAHSRKTTTMISSNAVLIDKLAEALVDCGLNTIKISMDAGDAETYKRIRGADYFDRIIKAVELLNYYKKAKNKKNPEIRFDFVVLKENYKNMLDLIILAEKLGIRHVYFRPLQSVGIGDERHEDLTRGFDYNELHRCLELAYKVSTAHKIKSNLGEFLHNFRNYKSIYLSQNSLFKKEICLLPWFQVFIAANGDISICCALYSNIGKKFGNVFDGNFYDVWNGKDYQETREFFKNGGKYKICQDCAPKSFRRLVSIVSLLPSFALYGSGD